MGVKSTVTLTREEAETKYRKLYGQVYNIDIPESNEKLANVLMSMNDYANDGEGFENYSIEGI